MPTLSPADRTRDLVAAFAEKLREQKARAQLTYRELGARAKFSHAHMVRADRGDELPSWEVAEAYLRACGIRSHRSLIVFQALWENAARSAGVEAQASRSASRKAAAASLRNIRTPEELGELLRRLAQRGSPVRKETKPKSLRTLAEETGFSKSTLGDWFAGNRVPSRSKLQALAVAIEATQTEITELLAARQRVELNALAAPTDSMLVLDNLDLGDDRQVVQQLATVLLQSADQRDRAAAVRTVGARAVMTAYSPASSPTEAKHRAVPTPEQLGKEQAELEELARRVAQILAETQSRRLRDPAALPLYSVDSARKLRSARKATVSAAPSPDPQRLWLKRVGVAATTTLSAVASANI